MSLAANHPYTLQLPDFSGPLDLLLRLIEKEELEITAISLAVVADQYLTYVRNLDQPDPLTVAEFLTIAAQLVLIKSRALLPRREPPLPPEEDTAEYLARQLREYQRFKHAAHQLRTWEHEGRRMWERVSLPPQPSLPVASLAPQTVSALVHALQRRLALMDRAVEAVAVPRPKTITIDEMVERITERLSDQAFCSFEDLLALTTTRAEVIVALWSVLELFKRQIISLDQETMFTSISLGRGERFGEPYTSA